jgi:hypothetical protein
MIAYISISKNFDEILEHENFVRNLENTIILNRKFVENLITVQFLKENVHLLGCDANLKEEFSNFAKFGNPFETYFKFLSFGTKYLIAIYYYSEELFNGLECSVYLEDFFTVLHPSYSHHLMRTFLYYSEFNFNFILFGYVKNFYDSVECNMFSTPGIEYKNIYGNCKIQNIKSIFQMFPSLRNRSIKISQKNWEKFKGLKRPMKYFEQIVELVDNNNFDIASELAKGLRMSKFIQEYKKLSNVTNLFNMIKNELSKFCKVSKQFNDAFIDSFYVVDENCEKIINKYNKLLIN